MIYVVTNHGGFKMTGASKKLHVALFAAAVCGCVYHDVPSEYQEGCAADDPRVGWIAELQDRFVHGVSGTARIVDNCTIVVENFYYDGIAADSRWVGVVNNDWDNMTVLSGTQIRSTPYVNETLTIPLPVGVTLDQIEQIGLVCLPGDDIFGVGGLADGTFHAP
jgi:hypothetical protein